MGVVGLVRDGDVFLEGQRIKPEQPTNGTLLKRPSAWRVKGPVDEILVKNAPKRATQIACWRGSRAHGAAAELLAELCHAACALPGAHEPALRLDDAGRSHRECVRGLH